MFDVETALPLVDDGTGGDEVASDGVFSATIPATASDPGQMVRWYVTASDSGAHESRWPLFEDPLGSAEYLGTVIADPSIVTDLPVLHRFIENTGAAETGTGTRASVYYLDEFYDNVFVRIRGGTARSWPKKAYKFKFNEGHGFCFDPELERVDEINVNLPAQINFMAVNVILQNIDATDKNYFIYRDTYGTGEWQMFPWDLDLTFGPTR